DRDRAVAARERRGQGRQGGAAPARRRGSRVIEGATLWELVEARAAATPDALFAVDERDRRLTFGDYRDAALRVGAGLHERGIGAETAVSWMLPTTLEALVLAAALARLAAVQNPILPIYPAPQTRFPTRTPAPSRATRGPRCAGGPRPSRGPPPPPPAQGLAREDAHLVVLSGAGPPPGGAPPARPAPPLRLAAAQPVRWILYSSGTTADP